MRSSAKPVRKCHACPMNLGDRCWAYPVPREQWRRGRRCPGPADADILDRFRVWLKRPTVKTRKVLRRETSGARRRSAVYAERRPKRGDRH